MLQLSPTPPVSLSEGWSRITALLSHLEDGLFGSGPDNPSEFTPADYAEAHSLAYAMCTVQSLCRDLYRRLGIHFADVAQRAVANRKEYNMETFARRVAQIFSYIDRTYASRMALPTVSELVRDAFFHARAARDIGSALSRLALTTGALGDKGEPILLDDVGGAGSSSGGAGPSGSGGGDPEDSDSEFEELTRQEFRDAVAGPRINELVAPGLVVKKVVHNGKEMNGVVATRDFKRCQPIGIYSGEVLTSDEYNSTTRNIAKAYAFETSVLQLEDADIRLIIVPALLPDGSGVDFQKSPLAALSMNPIPGRQRIVMCNRFKSRHRR